MKLRRNKKGFTIIELVIVIAVIGILAAVLIPTFVNLTNKANEAADNALVNNLNKALKMEEQEAGHQKAPTLEGAIKDLEDQGYILENLASKSGKDLLWSQSENQFLLNTEGKSGKDYWKIVDAVPAQDDQKYSYYAGKNFNQTDVTVKYGFDAGRIDNISKVTYVGTGSAQEVAIRTNSVETTLTVNAPADTVHHYDHLKDLTITAVDAEHSYHEHGIVSGKAVISQGHFEIEKNAVVSSVSVTAATGAVKVTANEQTTVMVDTASATQTAIVANAEKVNVAGVAADKISGEKASTVVTATTIMNEGDLLNAFQAKKSFVQLGADFALTSYRPIWSKFDLNGHTITVPASLPYGLIAVGKAELLDSVGSGKILGPGSFEDDEAEQCLVFVNGNQSFIMNGGEIKASGRRGLICQVNTTVKINSGKITDCDYAIEVNSSKVEINGVKISGSEYGVLVLGNGNNGSAELIVNGGEITSSCFAISGNGRNDDTENYSGTYIEINGGKITSSTDSGIYHPQNGVLKIKGNPVITGESALYIKSGVSTISGGKFVATLTPKADYNYSGNGSNATGDAIVIDACNYPGGNPSVEITIDNASFSLADSSAKNVAYYSHQNGAAVVVVNGQTLEPVLDN